MAKSQTAAPRNDNTAERTRLMGELHTLVDEDDFLDMVEAADDSDDPVAALRKMVDESQAATKADEDPADIMTEFKMRVVPKTAPVRRRKTRQDPNPGIVHETIGFIIERETLAGKLYAGTQMSWGQPNFAIPFRTEEAARKMAMYYADLQRVNAVAETCEMRDIKLTVAVAVGDIPVTGTGNYTLKVDAAMHLFLHQMLKACRVMNREFDGRPVQSIPDALRTLIRDTMQAAAKA